MKYLNIIDLHDFDCYSNINCRLLYLELCSLMDVKTRNAVVSIRSMERVLPCSYAAIRHALEQLIRCGLVTHIGTQKGAHGSAHIAAQGATHLHIMSYNELDNVSNAPSNAESNAERNAPNSADSNASKNKKLDNLNFKNNQITLAHAKDFVLNYPSEKLALYVDCAEYAAPFFKGIFIQKMELKKRTWKDENDLVSHFLDWCLKNKKSCLHRADERAAPQEPEQETQPEEQKHPQSIPLADWLWISRTVKSGQAAPAVIDAYKKGLEELNQE